MEAGIFCNILKLSKKDDGEKYIVYYPVCFLNNCAVRNNVELTSIKEVTKAFSRWLENYNFSREHEGINN